MPSSSCAEQPSFACRLRHGAVGGIGDTIAARVVAKASGAEFNLVTFSGGEMTALLGGNVDATISNPGEYLGQIGSGAIRALATTRQPR